MGRTVLVIEGDSPLGAALARLMAARGCAVVSTATYASERAVGARGDSSETPPALAQAPNALSVSWNRRSPVSARALLLSALNTFGALDEVFILEAPPPDPLPLQGTSSADIEKAFDGAKGALFVAREALQHFIPHKSGVLCMVSGIRRAAATPLETALREGFKGLASSLLEAQVGSGIVINGFQATASGPEEFAAFIDRALEERARKISGRWFTCPSRAGFLQGVLGQPRK